MRSSDPVLEEILDRMTNLERMVSELQPLKELYVGGRMATKIIGMFLAGVAALAGAIIWIKSNFTLMFK